MIEAGNATACRVGKTDLGSFHLVSAGIAAKLANHFHRLRRSCSADWVPAGKKPARGIDDCRAAQRGGAALHI